MKLKEFFSKNWPHFAVLAFVFIVACVFFQPQLQGYSVKQHDIVQWKGMSHETDAYREMTGKEPLWTNSMFGGMPTAQISTVYPGNYFKEIVNVYFKAIPNPIGGIILHILGFYILALFLRINPVVGLIGAIGFSFASYEIIILQAGHVTKFNAAAFLAPLLGAFIYSYRTNKWKGILFSSLFMTIELAMNHVQVTYYFLFVLLFVGIYFLYEAIVKKQIKSFLITSGGLVVGFLLAFAINIGNVALTADYAKNTIRGGNDVTLTPEGKSASNQSAGLDRDYITQWSYGKGETFTLLSPNVKGGGSFALGGSQFEEQLDNSDLSSEEISQLKNYSAYWGEQPFTSGPVYVGAIAVFLAFLGLVFLKTKLKWSLFAVTILAILLSWGKNFMGLTNFFIDHVPGYNKFRTVTIILILVELCVPVMAMLFLDLLIKERESLKAKKKQILIAIGSFVVFLLVLKFVGLGDNYQSSNDRKQISSIETNIREQIMSMDPAKLMSDYQLNVNDSKQVDTFIQQQAEPYYANFEKLKEVRSSIFNSSMNRTILFVLLAAGLILLFCFTTIPVAGLTVGLLLFVMLDELPVASNYLGSQEEGAGYKYWEETGKTNYPVSVNEADIQILETEESLNPLLKSKLEKARQEGTNKADELGYEGVARKNVIDSYVFMALNLETNYRVFDLNGGFSSTRASYFHKSLGGYHGAKLRNINNVFDYHLSKMNNKVYDMLNVKYFIQENEKGAVANPNPTALGNAWFVKKVEKYPTPNDEIRALGNKFLVVNKGLGRFLVNDEVKSEATIFGGEKLSYLIEGKDTISIPLSNGIQEGMDVLFVMDTNGVTNLIPAATLNSDTQSSFKTLVSLKLINAFNPSEEAVMLTSEASKLSSTNYSGEGSIKMISYLPNKLTYSATTKGKQLAVFSEIYYPDGWKAYVDGKEVEIRKVDYLLRGVELSNGKHKVEFVFDLPKYHTAYTVAASGSLILIFGFILLFYFDWKKRRTELK